MDPILTPMFATPLLGALASLSFALALLALLTALSIFAGLYYSVPRMIVKWLSRRALRAI